MFWPAWVPKSAFTMFEPLVVSLTEIGDADMDATKIVKMTLNRDEDVIFMRLSPLLSAVVEDSICS
jgi:hypothetical protein